METAPAQTTPATPNEFPCKSCGAKLTYAPGTDSLTCRYCGAVNEIALKAEAVEEVDFLTALRSAAADDASAEVITIKCQACAAEVTLPPNTTAQRCAFCGSPIVAGQSSKRLIKPRSLLPFAVAESDATKLFRDWIRQLWFAPGELTREAGDVRLRGIYIPAWTYDSRTRSDYTGERGDDYWETESYWDTETYTETENGRLVTKTRQVQKTRQVRKTRWTSVAGRVRNQFDDLLVLASRSLPPELAQKLEPWDLKSLIAYQDEFLSGFVCETYSVNIEEGFTVAQQLMAPAIAQTIRANIGGDHQRIHTTDTRYFDTTYKHILLPIWMCAYRYKEQTYRFLVNARTGEVQGERPYSALKIMLLVFGILAVIGVILLAIASQR